ncbi:hypothetical protein [Pseudoalteromonas sp. 2CM28B]|uniref:hypothetical protein n=1 Tax=Pseudoalteromonas sp. 2CM28B TaxID=2929851 RepID=UPI0020C1209A|nr:hypothetical protein [Pseudoalteromonas sp. 2CM28B]MCK8133602.1 hypothetical protein [Pseudoalteromonas sp. 2CM28B]
MKKLLLQIIAVLFILLGLFFAVVPGPSLIFFMAGLLCFSFYYPKATHYLKLCQKALTKSCNYLDKKLAR